MTTGKAFARPFLVVAALATQAAAKSPSPPVLESSTAQFTQLQPARLAPDGPIDRIDGGSATLSSFRGKVVLVNFWATWCAPCIRELPSLDALAAATPADQLAVLAVSVDEDQANVVKAFITRHPVEHLLVFRDPDHRLGTLARESSPVRRLSLYGLPITYVVDRQGVVVGYLAGAADWNSASAKNLIQYVDGLNDR